MSRTLPIACLLALAPSALAGAPAPIPHPIERAFHAPVVITGTITNIENELVEAAPQPEAAKVAHRVAVVRIEERLKGAEGLTHIKIGFAPPAKPEPGIRRKDHRERPAPELKVDQKMMFFLAKHPEAAFHVIPNTLHPVEAKSATYKAEVEVVKKALAAVADPDRALAAGNAQDRFEAALALLTQYRMLEGWRTVEVVPIAAAESRLILRALADGDWTTDPTAVRLSGFVGIYRLELSEADGWRAPGGKPGEEYTETIRKAYIAWLAGHGQDYVIKKFVPGKAK